MKTTPTDPASEMSEMHSGCFANVQFARGGSIEPGKPRHPWHWCILIQTGHIYHISGGWDTLADAQKDFRKKGIKIVADIEKQLAGMYSSPRKAPYDLNVVNPSPK